jgi:type IV pilus assembly protein PilX
MNAHRALKAPLRQRGAALVVGMILLLVLTVLAISGMNTSTLELQMAGNVQYSENAFQAAETGVERAYRADDYSTEGDRPLDSPDDHFTTVTKYNTLNGATNVPPSDGAYSMGEGGQGFSAYHFDVISTGTSVRGSTSTHVQSFYIKGPKSAEQ